MPGMMLISLATWREFFRPRLARIIGAARAVKPDICVIYHSEGHFEPILADLVEIGVAGVNPLQREHMDAVRIRRRFGPRLALWGALGRQTTFALGRPHEIREEVRTRIQTLGRAGLVLCPAYDIDEPNVPWANVVAFLEAGHSARVASGGDLARRPEPRPLRPTAARGPCASQALRGGLTRPLAFIAEGDAALSDNGRVQWTNATWHPVMGCSKVPQDCCCASYQCVIPGSLLDVSPWIRRTRARCLVAGFVVDAADSLPADVSRRLDHMIAF